MEISKVSYKKYECSNCGHVKDIQTNHYGECYGQPVLRLNMCPSCSWKRPKEVVIWKCIETPETKQEEISVTQIILKAMDHLPLEEVRERVYGSYNMMYARTHEAEAMRLFIESRHINVKEDIIKDLLDK